MQSFDFKKFLPHVLIVVGFAVFALIYCYPALQGKELVQGDVLSWMGMSHEGKTFHEKTGEDVLWSNSMFGGMPTFTYCVFGGHNYIYNVQKALELVGKPAYFLFIAMLCFYILMSVLRVDKWLGVIGSIAYSFSTFNIILIVAGHDTELLALCYMPAVIAGLLWIYQGKWLSGGGLLSVALSLQIMTNHYQVIYYTAIVIGFAVVGLLVTAAKEGKIRNFLIASLIALVIAGLAAGADMVNILPTVEYAKETMRGGQSELTFNHDKSKKSGGLDKDYAFLWSNGISETFCMIVPGLYGGSNDEKLGPGSNTYETLTKMGVSEDQAAGFTDQLPLYWGPQPIMSGPMYIGAIICFLFVLGLFVVKSQHKWWILGACVLAVMMSWGKHFPALNYFLFDHLPVLNKFRTPSMIMVIPQLLFPLLGIWALNDIMSGKLSSEEVWKNVKISAIITGGLCLILALGSSILFDFKSEAGDAKMVQQFGQMMHDNEAGNKIMSAIRSDRATFATTTGLWSVFFIAAAAGLLWAFSKKKVNKNTLIVGMGLLIVFDLFKVDLRYLNEARYQEGTNFENNFQPRPVDQVILRDTDPYYRVLDITKDTYNDAMQAYFHKCIGGYNPAKLEIYQDLIDVHMSASKGRFNAQVLNMLNTKYLIYPGANNQVNYQPLAGACGNAWFVDEIKWTNTADEDILALNANFLGDTTKVSNGWDPKKTAVIRSTCKSKVSDAGIGKDSAAFIRLAKYGLDDISFTSGNSKDGLGVFSDIYYEKGWKAFIDGKETPIIKANYVLRAIMIPRGNHNIEFHFHPDSFYTGDKIGIFSSLLIFGLCFAALYPAFRKRKMDVNQPIGDPEIKLDPKPVAKKTGK